MTGFWVSGILLVLYLFHVVERFYGIPWIQAEMIYCAVWTIGYFIASICVATYAAVAAFIAGAVNSKPIDILFYSIFTFYFVLRFSSSVSWQCYVMATMHISSIVPSSLVKLLRVVELFTKGHTQ